PGQFGSFEQGERKRLNGGWGEVRHLIAERLKDLTPLLGRLAEAGLASRDFH
ncbi:MAG: hypothetical protein IAE92_14100, partial [Burkholderiaceae bacterium]|nr:hypothetical protein [Burkholderiaceae bacterium]